MKLNYKPLGNYIKQIKKKNTDGSVTVLKGIRINKEFMESVANIQGTDLSRYRVVEKHQFAYNPMHVGRDEILPISVLLEDEPIIVSPAYVVFEILDHEELDPEYLMMWCRRSEFDRNVWFTTDSSVRGGFSWESLCELDLPIPSIEKQREIVKEYNTIVNRIKLNETLNQKLEETAQALYKHWFVDFEFPNEEGKPYKSSGGEMVYNEELDKEVPKGWDYNTFESLLLDVSDGNYSSKYPKSSEFLKSGVPFVRGTDFENKCINPFNILYISEKQHSKLTKGHTKKGDILLATRGEIGKYSYVTSDFINVNINAQLVRINGEDRYSTLFIGCLLNSEEFKEELKSGTTGSALQQLSRTNLNAAKLLVPKLDIIKVFSDRFETLLHLFLIKNKENHILQNLSGIILSKMSKVETKN